MSSSNRFFNPFADVFGGVFNQPGGADVASIYPPVLEHLILWADGTIISGSDVDQDPDAAQDPDVDYEFYRKDEISGFHIFITPTGDTITDDWDTVNATYLIHHDVLLVDPATLKAADALEGPFFFDGGGVEVARTQAEIVTYVADKRSVFFCTLRGVKFYDEVLTGSELVLAARDCGEDIVINFDGLPLTFDGESVYMR